MRKYRFTGETRWRGILKVLRWQLDLRVFDAQRRFVKSGSLPELDRDLLQIAYDNSRFLHLFLGYPKETKLEKTALNLLHQSKETK